MKRTVLGLAGVALAGASLVAGCGGSSSTSTASPTKTVATVPSSELVQNGHLLICSDIPSPPQEFYDANGNLVGSDIDTGNGIAARLGLQPVWVNSVFDTIIEALTAGKCDIIISGQNITPARQLQVHMVPYFSAGQTFVVKKGNPDNVSSDPTSLCGKGLAVQLGATEEVTAQGFSAQCQAAGKPAINIIVAQKSSDALQQVQTGHAVAFFQDSPVVAYYVQQQPSVFESAGGVISPIAEGISVPKDKAGLISAVIAALQSMESDGTYTKILKKWGEGNITVPPPS
jgi:polar amino acid transport system substrate-binding protein